MRLRRSRRQGGKLYRALSVDHLQRVMVGPGRRWRCPARRLGAARVTGVHPAGQLGDHGRQPGIPVPAALDAVERWSRTRLAGQPHPGPARRFRPRGRRRGRRGAAPRLRRPGATLTLTAPTRLIADLPTRAPAPGDTGVRDPHRRGGGRADPAVVHRVPRLPGVDDEAARAILTGSPARPSRRCATTTARSSASGGSGWPRPGAASPRCGSPPRRGGAASPPGCCGPSPAPPTGPVPHPAPADRHRQHHRAGALRAARLRAAPRLRQPQPAGPSRLRQHEAGLVRRAGGARRSSSARRRRRRRHGTCVDAATGQGEGGTSWAASCAVCSSRPT